jgi:hypothetical protein
VDFGLVHFPIGKGMFISIHWNLKNYSMKAAEGRVSQCSQILMHPRSAQMEKQVLAEGSKMVLVAFQSQYNQGVYGLVGNLGKFVQGGDTTR